MRSRSGNWWRSASTWSPSRSGTLPDGVDVAVRRRAERTKSVCCGQLEKVLGAVIGVPAAADAARLGARAGRRGANTGAGHDRRRTAAELLAANDEPARLMLLEVSGEPAPAMLRGFPSPWGANRSRTRGRPNRRAERKMIMERLLLSPDQVAESLGVCRSRVYDLMLPGASQRQDWSGSSGAGQCGPSLRGSTH